MNDDVLVVDFISPESKIRPSTRKQKEEITAKSQRIYGILGEPSQLEKYLGCSLFRDGCIKEFTNFDTNTRYEVTQPLKQYLLLARHHLCKLMGKYVVFPTLSAVNDIPYLISGTTAINYWIQTLAGGKEYKLPIIPTEDFDIKLDMKYTPQIEKLLTDKLLIETKRIFNDMQKYSNLKITDITYEWTGATDTLRRLIAKIELPQLLAQTGQSRLMFPVIEFSFHTGIKHLDDKRYLLPYLGIYLATPEYIRDDMCKGWNQFYKSERRQAKMAYWNLVFPEGHRLHQSNKFNVKNTDSCPN